MSFGRHLRALRAEAGLSRAGLARRAGVPVSTLRNWEGERGFPSVAAGLRLAGALGVAVVRLAEGVEDLAEDGPEPAGARPQRVRKGKAPWRTKSVVSLPAAGSGARRIAPSEKRTNTPE
jgi:transcriptional regulator with XRE-family HTH domain